MQTTMHRPTSQNVGLMTTASVPANAGDLSTRRARRRREILDAAAKIFAERGISETTVRDIGEAAGILSGSLYYHFESKDAIVQAIILEYLQVFNERLDAARANESDPERLLREYIQISFEVTDQLPERAAIAHNEARYLARLPSRSQLDDAIRHTRSRWSAVTQQCVATGVLRDDVDPHIIYVLVREAVWSTVRWYRPGDRPDTRRLAAAFTRTVLEGALNTSRRRDLEP